MKIDNLQLILPKDAEYSLHGGYECEWAFNAQKRQLLLAIQQYASVEYRYLLFEEVVGYKFSNLDYENLRAQLQGTEKEGFLYEVKSRISNAQVKHYLTLQPPGGTLQIYASAYRVLSFEDL